LLGEQGLLERLELKAGMLEFIPHLAKEAVQRRGVIMPGVT
jgi:hypothetical protein